MAPITQTNKTFLLAVFFFITILPSAVFSQNRWKLVWADEFDGTTIDTAKWSFQEGNGGPALPGWGNHELEYYRSENATVDKGKLTIHVLKELYSGFSYTSARMRTIHKGDWRFGKIEARMKLPKGQGIWPAFWMMPTDEVFGGWPKSGEIDIMEFLGHNTKKVYGTCHYGPPWPKNMHKGSFDSLKVGDFSSEFHNFSVEWNKDTIRWLVDDVKYFSLTKKELAPQNWPFNEKFHIILNCAVGGDWPGKPDAATIFPQVMEVDYVRVYQDVQHMGEVVPPGVKPPLKDTARVFFLDSFTKSSAKPQVPPDAYKNSQAGFDLYYEKASIQLSVKPAGQSTQAKILQVGYELPPANSWGNWASIRKKFAPLVSLKGYKGIVLRIKVTEPSPGAILRITLSDLGNKGSDRDELWWYDCDPALLSKTTGTWQEIRIPFSQFYISYGVGSRHNGGILNLVRINAYEINLVSKAGVNAKGALMVKAIDAYPVVGIK